MRNLDVGLSCTAAPLAQYSVSLAHFCRCILCFNCTVFVSIIISALWTSKM